MCACTYTIIKLLYFRRKRVLSHCHTGQAWRYDKSVILPTGTVVKAPANSCKLSFGFQTCTVLHAFPHMYPYTHIQNKQINKCKTKYYAKWSKFQTTDTVWFPLCEGSEIVWLVEVESRTMVTGTRGLGKLLNEYGLFKMNRFKD